MNLFISKKELDRNERKHGLGVEDICAAAAAAGVTDIAYAGDNSFLGADALIKAAERHGISVTCGAEISMAESGSIEVYPLNAKGRNLLLGFLHGMREKGAADFAAVKDALGGSSDVAVTTGWEDGAVRKILLGNASLEARTAALRKVIERCAPDEETYEAASREKKRLNAELKELTLYEDYERRVAGATDEDLKNGIEGMRRARREMERFVEGNRDRIAAVKKEIAGAERIMKVSKKGRDEAVRAGKQLEMCAKEMRSAGETVTAARNALRNLKEAFPVLYAQSRREASRGTSAADVIERLAEAEGVPCASCAFVRTSDGRITVPEREVNGDAVLRACERQARRDAALVIQAGGILLEDGRPAVSGAALRRAEAAARARYGDDMACAAFTEGGVPVLLTSTDGELWRSVPLAEDGKGMRLQSVYAADRPEGVVMTELFGSALLDAAEGIPRGEGGGGMPGIAEMLASASGERDLALLRAAEGALARNPAAFLCGLFNAITPDGYGRAADLCRETGVALLPPDINLSGYDFSVRSEAGRPAILTGLKAADARCGRYSELLEGIAGYRDASGGSFDSLGQFLSATIRIRTGAERPYECLPPGLLSALSRSGAFDRFGCDRSDAAAVLSEPIWSTRKAYCLDRIKRLRIKNGATPEPDRRRMETEAMGFFTDAGRYEECGAPDGRITGALAEIRRDRGDSSLLLKIVSGSGTHGVLLRGEAAKKYAGAAYSLLYEDVTVTGRETGEGFVAETLAEKPAGGRNALIPHATADDIAFIKSLGESAIKDPANGVRVAVMEWDGAGGTVKRGPVFYHFTPEAVKRCREHGVRFADPDRPAFAGGDGAAVRSA